MPLKIPPLVVGAAAAALMWLVAATVPAAEIAYSGSLPTALALALIGFIIAALGTVSFRKAGTTVNPMQPENASTLVVFGIYRYTRNPMYLGLLIMLLG